jgi:hypothetical protein
VRGFKDGMREGTSGAAEPPQVTGKTVDGEVRAKSEHKA